MTARRVATVAVVAGVLVLGSARRAECQVVGYGLFGPTVLSGGSESFLSGTTAGGAEFLVNGRVGVGVEAGFIGTPLSGWPVLTATGVWHMTSSRRGGRRLSPFAAAGISNIDDARDSGTGWNVGGGVDVWNRDRIGLRVDYREHFTREPSFTGRFSMLRVGVVFR